MTEEEVRQKLIGDIERVQEVIGFATVSDTEAFLERFKWQGIALDERPDFYRTHQFSKALARALGCLKEKNDAE